MTKKIDITGLGVDIVDIDRFKSFKDSRKNSFLNEVFTKKELSIVFRLKTRRRIWQAFLQPKKQLLRLAPEGVLLFWISRFVTDPPVNQKHGRAVK